MNFFFRFKRKLAFLLIAIFFFESAYAQEPKKPEPATQFQIGAEVQWYPAGWLIGPSANYCIQSKHLFNARLAINIANRHNWSGLNDDERGTGYGGSIGYRYLFRPQKNSFYLGLRTDLYSSNIRWKNKIGTPLETTGTTKILILQPSADIGYWIKLKKSKWNFVFSAGVGQEINVRTKGKAVGQGGMWLAGLSAFYTL